jgi:hypothetical protein
LPEERSNVKQKFLATSPLRPSLPAWRRIGALQLRQIMAESCPKKEIVPDGIEQRNRPGSTSVEPSSLESE